MFQMNSGEFNILKSQFVTSRWGGLRRARPYAFTEQGVAMLSSVLKSRRFDAIREIMRPPEKPRPIIGFQPEGT